MVLYFWGTCTVAVCADYSMVCWKWFPYDVSIHENIRCSYHIIMVIHLHSQ